MATELAVGYISLSAETSKIPRQVRDMFDGPVSRESDRGGKSMGSKLASGIGAALKTGGVAAAAAGGVAMGAALTKGFQRLTAIDDAQGKLAGLGHTAQSTSKVMDSALSAVKGTAFGLGDAATIAASAVAAGIKPGQDLSKYLSMTADAATIAGTSLGDMGLIFNQVQTGQSAFTDDLNQLAGRGIPIYQWLGKEMHMTGAEVKDMASKGKISSEMFFQAIQKNIGGAAQESGKTVRGSFENVKAALGRLGAAVEGPSFKRLPTFLGALTKKIDEVTPAAQRMAQQFDGKVFEVWGPKVREALEAFKDSGSLKDAQSVFSGLGSALAGFGPSVTSIASSLTQASAALGVSGWQLFLTTLQASTTVLNLINPVLSTTAGLMEDNRGAVVALLAAWMAFKTVPSVLGRISDSVAPMSGRIAGATKSMKDFNVWTSATVNTAAYGKVQMGQFGTSIAQIGSHAPVVARMQGAFVNAAVGADRFGRTAGVAAAAGTGLKAAGAGVAGIFGGPVGLALAGAAVLGTAWASSVAKQNEATNAYRSSLMSLNEEQKRTSDLLIANRGAVTGDVYSSMSSQVDHLKDSLVSAGKATASLSDSFISGITFGANDQEKAVNDAARASQAASSALDKLGMSSTSVSQAILGSQGAFDGIKGRLIAMGDGGRDAAAKLQELRDKALEQQDVAQRVTPGISQLGEALRVMGDKGSTSSDKLSALKAAMDALNPARSKTEAMAQYGEAIRRVAESTEKIGPIALNADGSLNSLNANSATLARTLQDLADKSAQVASTGGDMKAVAAENDKIFQQLAASTGRPIEKIRALYESLGGKTVDLTVKLAGAPEAVQEMAKVKAAFEASPDKKTISVETSQVTPQTVDALRRIGFLVNDQIPGGKTIEVTANDQASAKLALVTQNVNVLNMLRANPQVDLNKVSFDAKDGEARAALLGLDRTAVSPQAGLVIDKLLQGKAVSMQELNALSQTTANPKVDMEIAKLMEKLGIANAELDKAARPRTATITVNKYDPQGILSGAQGGMQVGPPAYSAGGWTGPGSKYQEAGIVHADEYVVRKSSRRTIERNHPGALDYMNATGRMPGYAEGGRVGVSADDFRRLAEGQGVSRPLEGAPYVWGGINWGDCSGAMSPFARLAAGLPILGGRFATASMAQQLQSMGAKMGRGPSGSMRFGWLNGGPGGGHTAGTLPDGTNVEMGGNRGNGQLGGGAAGADDPQFTDHAYFEVGPSWSDPGSDHGGMVQRPDGTWVPAGNGDYSSSSSGVGSGKDTISGRFGAAIGSFFEGQLADIFETFGASDKPGWMQAIAAYENSQRSGSSSSSGGGTKLSKEQRESLKMEFDQSKQSLRQDYEADKLKRKQEYELSRQKLEDEYTAKRINKAEYERRLNALKQQHDKDDLAKKQDYDRKVDDAKAKYDSARGKSSESGLNGKQGYESGSLAEKQRYENTKLAEEQKYDAERASRKAQYDADMDSLQAQRKSKAIDKDQYKARSEALKAKYDNDLAGMKTRYENAELQRKQEYDRQSLSSRRRYDDLSSAQRSGVRDPGMSRPQAGQDMGLASTGNPVKDAFRSGMRPAWQDGQPWTDTDWIVGKESSWNPTARNPSGAFGLAQFLGTTKDKYLPDENPDPRVQGTAYDRYVGDRYQTPMGARKHWEANNWYDQGGSAVGTGLMAKNVLAPERVLSPRQTEAFEQMVRHNFNGGTASLEAKLDEMIGLLGAGVGRTTNVTVKDMGGYWDRERQLQRTGIARHRGGR